MSEARAEGETLLLVGTGRAAHALGFTLQEAGVRIGAVTGRSRERVEALARDLGTHALGHREAVPREVTTVLLLEADDAIEEVARDLGGRAFPGIVWMHASGSRPASVLSEASRSAGGGPVLAWHPLAVLDGRPRRLDGVTVTLSGDADALPVGERLAGALGGRAVRIGPGEDRVGYHLAACLAAGHIAALLGEATAVARASGLGDDVEDIMEGLYGLAREAIAAVRERGAAKAVTGPVVRGDVGTVERHLAWLEREGGPGVDRDGALMAYAGGGLAAWYVRGQGTEGRPEPDGSGGWGNPGEGPVPDVLWRAMARAAARVLSGGYGAG